MPRNLSARASDNMTEWHVLIAEQLMLLCIDPARGVIDTSRTHVDIEVLAAAALMLDLAEQKRLRFNADFVAIETDLPISHVQLTAAAQTLGEHGLRMDAALDLIVARMAPISRHLLDGLFRRDLLHRVRAAWWPGSGYRYPMRSLQARNEAITQLVAATRAGAHTLRGDGLLLLVDLAGCLAHVVDGAAHAAATAKLLDLAHIRDRENQDQRLLRSLRQTLLD